MSIRTIQTASCALFAVVALSMTGCLGGSGPTLGIFSVPIPVTPYQQKQLEDKFHEREYYDRVPIMGPLTAGGPAVALDEPSDDEVMVALERARPVEGGIPFLHEIQRNRVTIVKERLCDYVDPPRVVPMLGPVQLHHAHYKCTVYFQERKIVSWPFPHTIEDEVQEVVYIDHNHFHQVGNVDGGPGSHYHAH